MSFSQNTNSFFIKGTVTPHATKPGSYGYDCEFISESGDHILKEEDYMVPLNQRWQIALAGIEFVHIKECFHFPTAANAKTKEWNNVYELYEIEIDLGLFRYWPILKDGNTHPWHSKGVRVLGEIESFGKPFTGQVRRDFSFHNYLKSVLCTNIKSFIYQTHYHHIGVNKFSGGMIDTRGVHLARFWSGTCDQSFKNIPVPYTNVFGKIIPDLILIFRKSISFLIFHTKTLKIGTVLYTAIVKIDTVLYTNIWKIDTLPNGTSPYPKCM